MIGVCAVFAHYRHRAATWLWLENVSTAINVYGACAITPIYLLGVCNAEQISLHYLLHPVNHAGFLKNDTNEYNFELSLICKVGNPKMKLGIWSSSKAELSIIFTSKIIA